MSKILTSTLIGDIAGSIHNLTYVRGPAGLTAMGKKYRIPKNTGPVTAKQWALAEVCRRWRLVLGPGDWQAWNALAATITHPDKFGVLRHGSGRSLFLRGNLALYSAGQAFVDTAPATFTCGNPTTISADATGGPPLHLVVTPTTNPGADEAVEIWSTPYLKPGVTHPGSTWRLIYVLPAATPGPWNAAAAYDIAFGEPPSGSRIKVRVNYISVTSGAKGSSSTDTASIP